MSYDNAGVCAHRGASGLAPENTLSAFNLAARSGVRWIETDLSLMADGTLLVHHDKQLGRCVAGDAEISILGWEDVKSRDAGSWFDETFAAETLLTLPMLLDWQDVTGVNLNLEMKCHSDDYAAMAKSLVSTLDNASSGEACEKWIISSFNAAFLGMMQKSAPRYRLALIALELPENWQELAKNLNLKAFHLHHRALERSHVETLRASGLRVGVFTVNDAEVFQRLTDWGVDMIMTDYPENFMRNQPK